MRKVLITAIGLAAFGVSACSSPEPMDHRFGNATRHNKAMHIINPEPLPATTPAPAMDGMRGMQAMERYETGTIKEPEEVSTTDTGD
jgi:hypothetical protein